MSLAAGTAIVTLQGSLRRCRRSLEKSTGQLQDLCKIRLPDEEDSCEEYLNDMEAKIDTVRELHDNFTGHVGLFETNATIVGGTTHDDELDNLSDFSATVIEIIAKANVVFKKATAQSNVDKNPVPPSGTEHPGDLESQITRLLDLYETRAKHSSPSVKLPFIPLPKFGGDLLKWKPFWDRFEAAVDKNVSLSAVDKLNYLFGQLFGDPLKMIENLPLTNENYPIALELLKQKYGKPKMMIAALYRRFNELQTISNEPNKLRVFCTEIECILGGLTALGQNVNDDHFVSMILSKLPETLIMTLEFTKDVEDDWSVTTLRKALSNQIERLDSTQRAVSNPHKAPNASPKAPNSQSHHKEDPGHFSGEALFANSAPKTPNYQTHMPKYKANPAKLTPYCVFCETTNHYSDNCKKFSTVVARKTKLNGRCFNCLSSSHGVRECPSTKPCFHCKRVKNHHSSLCFLKFPTTPNNSTNIATEGDVKRQAGAMSSGGNTSVYASNENALLASGEMVVLQTAFANVRNGSTGFPNHGQSDARILFDIGSNRSYCTEGLADKLNLRSSKGPDISVNRFGTEKSKLISTKIAKMNICLDNGKALTIFVTIVPVITGALCRPPVPLDEVRRVADKLKLADTLPSHPQKATVDLLIGNDYYADIVTGERLQVADGLYLVGSKLGWILTGRTPMAHNSAPSVALCVMTDYGGSISEIANLQMMHPTEPAAVPSMEDLWSLESVGIKDSPYENDDQQALEQFAAKLEMRDSRYFVGFPWKDDLPELPDNYRLSWLRLQSLVKKFDTSPELLAKYADILEDQKRKGIIEVVDEHSIVGPRCHYIPHHAVVTPTKATTKVRIVYDGSARISKRHPSLNECLLRGPVILEDLCGLLMRFRLPPIALTADIEKAFLQVGIVESDRDVTRFLWLKDPTSLTLVNNLEILRFCSVPFGLICSPFLLEATVQHHLKQNNSSVANAILQDHYVDNVLTGTRSPEEGKKFYNEAKTIFRQASMNLREWASNSKEIMSYIPETDKACAGSLKVLGILWNPESDRLSISLPVNNLSNVDTKRGILKTVASVFDPLGYLLPITVRARILLQDVCNSRVTWDEPICQQEKAKWTEIRKDWQSSSSISISRCIGPLNPSESAQLLCFCDASDRAYATVIYLRREGQVTSSNLLFAKGRLNPIKKLTIPRLELLAIFIGVKALKFVKDHLKIPLGHSTLWSDSQCALSWIKSSKPLGRFVENRVKKIRESVDTHFRYVSTDQNPADLATRGIKCNNLTPQWWVGPSWLLLPKPDWPSWNVPEIDTSLQPDDKCVPIYETSSLAASNPTPPPFDIDRKKYSSLKRLLHVTAYCLRFVRKLKMESSERTLHLSPTELSSAKLLWESHVQKTHYNDMITKIRNGRKHQMMGLGLRLDSSDIIRCHGRLDNSDLSFAAKFPKLLPKDDTFTKLTIARVHEKVGHVGISHTLNAVRNEYWIPHGRTAVKSVVRKCYICIRFQGFPFPLPQMPELPKGRVLPQLSFDYSGLDYFGPLSIKSGSPGNARKVWVCLFTCMSIRAVHLELVHDLSADEFLMALRRFVSRRGKPRYIVSDNAPQFKLVKTIMDQTWSSIVENPDVLNYCADQGITWTFITEYAPWQGGVYERMVGIVKQSLRKTLGKSHLNASQLTTILCETEAIVNSRPLSYVGDDIERATVLTPSHFLMLNPKPGIPVVALDENYITDPDYTPLTTTSSRLIQTWKKGTNLLDQFWSLWRSEYLLSLREKIVQDHPNHKGAKFSPSIGDVVLIKELFMPRGSWKMGRITDLKLSADSEIRSAYITLPSRKTVCRPVNLLYPLEFPVQKQNSVNPASPASKQPNVQKLSNVNVRNTPPRPRRKAAVAALKRCRQMLNATDDEFSDE